MIDLKIMKTHKDAFIPEYAHESDAGMDLRALRDYRIFYNEQVLIETGIAIEIPEGYYGRVESKSGLALKEGIFLLTGTIDEGYRGSIGVVASTVSSDGFEVIRGMKVAQLVICPVARCNIKEVNQLSNSERGKNGYGSTGL